MLFSSKFALWSAIISSIYPISLSICPMYFFDHALKFISNIDIVSVIYILLNIRWFALLKHCKYYP